MAQRYIIDNQRYRTFDSEKIDEALNNYLKEKMLKLVIFITLRICIVGTSKGPHLSTIMQFIGKQETINRIEEELVILNNAGLDILRNIYR